MAETTAVRLGARHHILTYLALVLLATASLVVARLFRAPYWDLAIAMAIAGAKMALVLWFFMHMAEQPFRTRLVALVALVLVAVLIALTSTDVLTRELAAPRPAPSPIEGFYRR